MDYVTKIHSDKRTVRKKKVGLFLQLSWLTRLLLFGRAQSFLVREPVDVFAVRGSTVVLSCYTNLSLPVSWELERIDEYINWENIFKGNPGDIPDVYQYKYNVSVDSTSNQYNLTIKNVQPEDSGTYRCGDRMGIALWDYQKGIPGNGATSELIVIDAGLKCQRDDKQSQVVTSDNGYRHNVRMICNINYKGNIAPTLTLSPMTELQDGDNRTKACLQSVVTVNDTDTSGEASEYIITPLAWVPAAIPNPDVNTGETTAASTTTCECSTTPPGIVGGFIIGTVFGIILLLVIEAILLLVRLKINNSKISDFKNIFLSQKKSKEVGLEDIKTDEDVESTNKLMTGNCATLGEEFVNEKGLGSEVEQHRDAPTTRDEADHDSVDREHERVSTSDDVSGSQQLQGRSALGKVDVHHDPHSNELSCALEEKKKLTEKFQRLFDSYNKYFTAYYLGIKMNEMEHNKLIAGVAVVKDDLFVVKEAQSQVNRYHIYAHSLSASLDIPIPDMKSPVSLAGCAYHKALYISDDELECIHRVDLTDNSFTRWKMRENHVPCGLSVTAEHTLLVTVQISGARGESRESRVVEYTSEGQQLREIIVDKSIDYAWQTVQMSCDKFIVCHGSLGSNMDYSFQRVCLVDNKGQILQSYGAERGGGKGRLSAPFSVAVDDMSQHIFVADCENNRVLLLDANLYFLGQVYAPHDLDSPSRLFFDSAADRLLIGHNTGLIYTRSPYEFIE